MTVSMDQARQAVQLCGKLLFGQMQELTNVNLSGGLPPNLAGSNTNTGNEQHFTCVSFFSFFLNNLFNDQTQ